MILETVYDCGEGKMSNNSVFVAGTTGNNSVLVEGGLRMKE